MPKVIRLAPALAVLLAVAGCGGDNFQKVYPVKGKVLVDGQPCVDCMVTLHRTFDDNHPRKVLPYALTDENGDFQITSYVTNDGAPEGEYVATVEWRTRSGLLGNNYEGPDLLEGAHADKEKNKAKAEYVVTVAKGPVTVPTFNVTLTAAGKKKLDEYKKKAAERKSELTQPK